MLQQALTHRSHAAGANNERLEFLGDAIIGMRVNERLFEAFPSASEGALTRLRAWIVSSSNLAAAATRLRLGDDLLLSRAEEAIGGRRKPRLLANVLEAVTAAIHLDGGYGAASAFLDRHVLASSLDHLQPGQMHDFAYKSALQEWAHAGGHGLPQYRVVASEGPEHGKTFTVEVSLDIGVTARGVGSSKKRAEQQAAAAALAALGAGAEEPGNS